MSVDTGVNIKGNNRDLLRAIAESKVALSSLAASNRDMGRSNVEQTRQLRDVNRELKNQSQALKGVALDYRGVRGAVMSFGVRGAVVGIGQLVSALNMAVTAAGTLGTSLSNVGGAVGIGLGAELMAGAQGAIVLKLAMANLGNALTTTGRKHELALAKLSQPQRSFVKEATGVRNAYRQLQVTAQNAVLPGLVEAGKHLSNKLLPELRTGVHDTGKEFAYLADRGVGMLNKRMPEFDRVLQRNAITIERGGRTIENFGSGLLSAFPKVEPLIGHITTQVENFSKNFKDKLGSKSGQAELGHVFDNMRKSWDNWTATFGAVGKSLFHIWDAAQPATHEMENAVEGIAKQADKWTGSHKDDIAKYFKSGLKPLGAFAKLVGAMAKDLGIIAFANNDSTAKFFDGLRTQFLPVLMEVITALSTTLAPKVGDLLKNVLAFIHTGLPGFKGLATALGELFGHLSDLLGLASKLMEEFNKFGAVGSAIGALVISATVLAGWKMLRQEMKLTFQAASYYMGVSEEKPVKQAFINALPGDKVFTKGRQFVQTRAQKRYTLDPETDASYQQFLRGEYSRGSIPGGRDRNGLTVSGQAPGKSTRLSRLKTTVAQMAGFAPRAYPGRGTMSDGTPLGRLPADYYGQYGTGSGVFTITEHGSQTPSGVQSNLPKRGVDKNGKAYFYDEQTGKRVPKPPLYQDATGRARNTAGGRVVSRGTAAWKGASRSGSGIMSIGATLAPAIATEAESGVKSGIVRGLKGAASVAGPAAKGLGATLAASFGLAYLLDGSTRKSVNNQLMDKQSGDFGLPKTGITDSIAHLPGIKQAKGLASMLGLTDKGKEATDRAQEMGDKLDELYKKANKLGDTRGLVTIAQQARDAAKEFPQFKQAFSDFAVAVDHSAGDASDQIALMTASGGKHLKDIRQAVFDTTFQIKSDFGPGTAKAKDALSRNFAAAVTAIKKSMSAGVISTTTGMKQIQSLFKQNLALYGITGSAAKNYLSNSTGDTSGKGSVAVGKQGAARGGMYTLPGQNGPDSIPMNINGQNILAAPGEDVAIINRHQRKYIDSRLADVGGLSGVFKKVNRKHFAAGGWVTGDTDYLPSVGNALTKMAKGTGTPISVQSGRRTMAEQVALYAKYLAGTGNLAAKPNANAPHVRGIAADITPGREKFGGVAGQYGLGFTVPSESWHIQILNAAAAVAKGGSGAATAVKTMKRVMASAGGALGGIQQGAFDALGNAANSQMAQIVGAASGSYGGDAGQGGGKQSAGGVYSKSELAALWRRAGGNPGVANLMAAIALAESGGNPGAHNPSGADGLWQILGVPFPGNTQDPFTNAKMAVAKYDTQGLGAWEAYTNGSYRTYMNRGGFLKAGIGYSTAPPTRGTDPGAVNPNLAVTTPAPKKKTAPKPKVRNIAGNKPTIGEGLRASQFKPATGKSKPIRKSIKRLLNEKFGVNSIDPNDITDPLTGERLDLSQVLPVLGSINGADDWISQLNDQLSVSTDYANQTDEAFLVELTDTDQFKDLTNYLKGQGIVDPAGWMDKYSDSAEVVNDSGRVVQGEYVRGIAQYVAEIQQQLAYHTTNLAAPTQVLMGGGIMGLMQWQKQAATNIPADQAIQERVTRLNDIRTAVEATIELRKAQFRKLAGMGGKGYTYKSAIDHNKGIITAWQRWKRDSVGETLGETRSANSEIDRLTDENTHLARTKPKGKIYGDAAYQKESAMYNRSRSELNLLTGDPAVQTWTPSEGLDHGLMGSVLLTLNEWKDVKDTKMSVLSGLLSSIPQEQLNIDTLSKEMSDATGTKAAIPQLNQNSQVNQTAQQISQLNDQILGNKMVDALTANVDFDVLKNFAGSVQGRYVGAFRSGGLVPETGMALVHKGEFINPAPDGPQRNGMNAAAQLLSGGSSTEIHLHGELAGLVKLIDARIDGRSASVSSSRAGRRQRIIKAAPGV